MGKYNCIIIDDENKARLLLQALIQDYCPELEVVGMADDLISGIEAIRQKKPDLVFLDIEMPGHSGLELLDMLGTNNIDFEIIFTTAYQEYAVEAFRLSALDYLLKPIDFPKLREAIDRFVRKKGRIAPQEQLDALKFNLSAEAETERRVVIPIGQSYKFIKSGDIIMIKGDGAYSEVYLQSGDKFIVSRNLKSFGEMLSMLPNFYRCHKSYLINLRFVKEFVKSEGGRIILGQGIEAGISHDKVDEFMRIVQNF